MKFFFNPFFRDPEIKERERVSEKKKKNVSYVQKSWLKKFSAKGDLVFHFILV